MSNKPLPPPDYKDQYSCLLSQIEVLLKQIDHTLFFVGSLFPLCDETKRLEESLFGVVDALKDSRECVHDLKAAYPTVIDRSRGNSA